METLEAMTVAKSEHMLNTGTGEGPSPVPYLVKYNLSGLLTKTAPWQSWSQGSFLWIKVAASLRKKGAIWLHEGVK